MQGQRAELTYPPSLGSVPGLLPAGVGQASPAPGSKCRIRSLPLKSVFPVIISAMMQPTDQMSTETEAPPSGPCGLGRGAHTDAGVGAVEGGMGPGAIEPTTPCPAPAQLSSLPAEQLRQGRPRKLVLRGRISGQLLTRLCVVHPIQDDLRRPVPPGHHVSSHLAICLPGQAKVQDLQPESEGGAEQSLGSGWASRGPEDPKGTGHTGALCQPSGARGRSQVPLSLPAGSSPQPAHPAQPTMPAPDP